MKRSEYLKDAFKKFTEGKISAEAYDAILENIENFCETDEEENEMEEIKMNKNLYVYDKHVYAVIDETPTHYVCAPKNNQEGYGYIPKIEAMSLEDYENRFDLSTINLEGAKSYNKWIAQEEGYFDYSIFMCSECGKYIFGRGEKKNHICDTCKDKDNFRVLIRYCDGNFNTRIYKNYIDAYKDMEKEIKEEAIDYDEIYNKENITAPYDDGYVICKEYDGFVSGTISQEDVYWVIQTFSVNQIITKQSDKVKEIIKNNSLTEYEKLRWGEENGAENIEIAILAADGSVPKDLSQHGCACSSPEGNVNIYYGKEDGADDKTITIKTFNEKIKVTNINFI